MILVFGGTTEGRKAVQVLEEAGTPYYYSTRSDGQEVELVHGRRLTGDMNQPRMVAFCKENDIRMLVDAAHPFAVELHRNLLFVARHAGIPIIRYDRQYPPHTDDITWCRDYDDAIAKLEAQHIERLLALTGVQTIGRLRPYWERHECWCRILDRRFSRIVARQAQFPEDHLVFYEHDDTETLLQQLHPQAILTKESGISGGFCEKVEAAKAAGVQVFVVERPPYPPHTPNPQHVRIETVNGPHGLRLKIQQLLPEFFPLKTGLTTGTCATAAARAAFLCLMEEGRESREEGECTSVSVRIPDGEDIEVPVASVHSEGDSATATVIKDAGDDPDVTDGLAICATVRMLASSNGDETGIIIKGGEGIGTVTLPGLGLPVGAPAINETPQRMIRENLTSHPSPLTPHPSSQNTIEVTLSVPDGRATAEQTFNPRIGVVGGISIIGTSGIVRPFSADAWISSIRKEMSVGLAASPLIVINSGAKSEKFLRARYPELPEQAFIHYGNFIGETIRIAAELKVRRLVMGVMIGKAVKLAEGNLDTHSHKVTLNRDFLLQMAQEAQLSLPSPDFSNINLARELWDMLPAEDMGRMAQVILCHCHEHCAPLLPDGQLTILLISEKGDIISQNP